MVLLQDFQLQYGKHSLKNKYFSEHGVEVRRTKLYVGDYTLPTDQSICVKIRSSIQELISDICGKSASSFRSECVRAQEVGIKLIILVENKPGYANQEKTVYNGLVRSVEDLNLWRNPRAFIQNNGKQKYPTATTGEFLAAGCLDLCARYEVEFQFCTHAEAGERVLTLLGVKQQG